MKAISPKAHKRIQHSPSRLQHAINQRECIYDIWQHLKQLILPSSSKIHRPEIIISTYFGTTELWHQNIQIDSAILVKTGWDCYRSSEEETVPIISQLPPPFVSTTVHHITENQFEVANILLIAIIWFLFTDSQPISYWRICLYFQFQDTFMKK